MGVWINDNELSIINNIGINVKSEYGNTFTANNAQAPTLQKESEMRLSHPK